jgi:hypothetical protein
MLEGTTTIIIIIKTITQHYRTLDGNMGHNAHLRSTLQLIFSSECTAVSMKLPAETPKS